MADTAFWLELKGKFGSLKGDFEFHWSSAGSEEDIPTRERGHSGWIFWRFPDEAGRQLFEGYSKMGAQALLGDAVTEAWLDELKRRGFGFEVDAIGTDTLEEVGSIRNAVGASVDLCELLSVDAHLQTRSARVGKQHSAASPEESARSEQPKGGRQDEPADKVGVPQGAKRRGPKPRLEEYRLVAQVVAEATPGPVNWRKSQAVVSEALDEAKIPVPSTWKDKNWRTWDDCDDLGVWVKVIEYRLRRAKE